MVKKITTKKQFDAIAGSEPEFLTLVYAKLELLEKLFLVGNSKKHDLLKLRESVEMHGFKKPLKYDPALNNGKGGIQLGNGRLEFLGFICRKQEAPPKGILALGDSWFVPVLFGVNDANEEEAIAFSITDNIAPSWGGGLDFVKSTSKLFNQEKLSKQITKMTSIEKPIMPVGINAVDMTKLDKIRVQTENKQPGKGLLEPGDEGEDEVIDVWGIYVSCDSENHQAEILAFLNTEGFKCKAIV